MSTTAPVSFVLATYNRRATTLDTLRKMVPLCREASPAEIVVVDNASSDGTHQAVRDAFPEVRLIRLRRNLGSCAKAFGVERSAGRYVVFLDDDSCPRPGTIARMIERFEADPSLGAAGFTVHLPDGRRESSGLPGVFVGCGAGFRREALLDAGGLDRTFFMQAEEYDLAFRLARAGWEVDLFDDLHVDHLKSPQARLSGRTLYYDTRNNLVVIARYAPDRVRIALLQDYTQRYRWIAEATGHLRAWWRGRAEGWRCQAEERCRWSSWRLDAGTFERFFRFAEIERRMAALAAEGMRGIVLADLGKNIYPFVRGAARAGLKVLAIGDDRFARPGRCYRGVAIVPVAESLAMRPDAMVVSNCSPVHAQASRERLSSIASVPVHCWFGERPSLSR